MSGNEDKKRSGSVFSSDKVSWRASAAVKTLPVMAGYMSLGAAFGILLFDAGYGPLWALFMSVFIFAGSAQFLAVELLASGATIPQTIMLTFLLNFRHFFYGLTMITKYKVHGYKKLYSIFGLTDETYAILSSATIPTGIDPQDYYAFITLLDHIYWIIGSLIGSIAGALIPFDLAGIDFAMTALFAVLVVEQWKSSSKHFPAILGLAVTFLSLKIFGPDRFLIPALIVISSGLLCVKKFSRKSDGVADSTT